MRLFDAMATECVRLVPTQVPDGEGGTRSSFADGDAFMASVTLQGRSTEDVAGAESPSESFAVATHVDLAFHEAFRRVEDGRTFRVTSRQSDTPGCATFAFKRCTAEAWEVPDGD